MGAGDMLQNRAKMHKAAASLAARLLALCLGLMIPRRFRTFSSCSVSFVVHLLAILVLAFWLVWNDVEQKSYSITVLPVEGEIDIQVLAVDIVTSRALMPGHTETSPQDTVAELESLDTPEVSLEFVDSSSGETSLEPTPSPDPFRPSDLMQRLKSGTGGGFEGRTGPIRARLVAERGGSEASEDAVARGLAWLAAHQREDGSWWFDHRDGLCRGLCRDPGTHGSTTASTALALLAFLGAGEVTEESQYKEVVDKGLYYLSSRLIVTPHGGDLQEGTMYAQGIATIALCEAYAMTEDESIGSVAQQAVNFICTAQHAEGGWRYYPGQPGDTTVYGWQVMALKSARMAGLDVPDAVLERAKGFLDRVQVEDGAYYGYMTPERLPTPTAVGLLARMYFGWPQNDPRLAKGVAHMEKLKPSRTDMYFNYYAMQVMHHYEGDGWDAWNHELRDRLIATQSRRGHEHGSWYFHDEHGKTGGRLYTTAMCIMILEVYYRHMPLYGAAAVEGEF